MTTLQRLRDGELMGGEPEGRTTRLRRTVVLRFIR